MRQISVVLMCCVAVLLCEERTSYAAPTVTSPFFHGYYDSLQQAQDWSDTGVSAALYTDDTSPVYFRFGATISWTTFDDFPYRAKLELWEDDNNPDDFVGTGLLTSLYQDGLFNPADPSDPLGMGQWTVKVDGDGNVEVNSLLDYVETSGQDLADKCGSSGEPGWHWELEVRIKYKLGDGIWTEVDPSGWEKDQQFIIP